MGIRNICSFAVLLLRRAAAAGSVIGTAEVAAIVEDGMGGYLVWLRNGADRLWTCNASTDAELYALTAWNIR